MSTSGERNLKNWTNSRDSGRPGDDLESTFLDFSLQQTNGYCCRLKCWIMEACYVCNIWFENCHVTETQNKKQNSLDKQ